jgi:hypothetical protein
VVDCFVVENCSGFNPRSNSKLEASGPKIRRTRKPINQSAEHTRQTRCDQQSYHGSAHGSLADSEQGQSDQQQHRDECNDRRNDFDQPRSGSWIHRSKAQANVMIGAKSRPNAGGWGAYRKNLAHSPVTYVGMRLANHRTGVPRFRSTSCSLRWSKRATCRVWDGWDGYWDGLGRTLGRIKCAKSTMFTGLGTVGRINWGENGACSNHPTLWSKEARISRLQLTQEPHPERGVFASFGVAGVRTYFCDTLLESDSPGLGLMARF